MIALSGPKLKQENSTGLTGVCSVSMIALSGPKLKPGNPVRSGDDREVSMIALSGPKLKRIDSACSMPRPFCFNDSTEWA